MNFSDKFRETSEILSPMDSAIASELNHQLNQAEVYFRQGNVATAIESVYQVIKGYPTCATAYKLLGNMLLSQGKIAQASRCYQTAIALDPQLAEALANLGSVAYQQGDFDQAIAYYQKSLELNPSLTGVYGNLAKVLQQQGREQEASKLPQQLEENNWKSYFNQGNNQAEQGELDRAIEFYQKSLALHPHSADAYLNLGIVFRRKGELNAAIQRYEKALEINPNFADAHFHLGNVYFQLSQYAQARDCWEQALSIQPGIGGADAQVNLGNVLIDLGQISAGIQRYFQALEMDEHSLKANYNLGNLLSQQGKLPEAIAHYRKVIEIDPKFMPGYLSLGEILENLGKWDEAIEAYINVLKIQFHESVIFHKLGNLMSQKGNLNDAQTFYSRNIPIQVFKKYYPLAQNWEILSKEHPKNSSIHIDIYPRSFHYLSSPKTTDKELHYRFKESHCICSPVFVTVIPQGRIFAADSFNQIVFNSENALLGNVSTGNLFWLADATERIELESLEQTIAYISVKSLANYYHWLADVLPRLELIRQSGIPLESIDKFIINPTGLPIQPETLNLLGIPPEKIWIGEEPIHIKAKELIIPAVTGSIWYMSKWVCDFLRQQFLPLAQQNQSHQVNKYPEKIYICRESQYRRVINEPEIIAALTERGFEIVRLESLSFLEQVALFAGAKVVISPHGSGLTDIVFCQPGTKVLELFPSTYIVRFYWKLSSFLNLDYYYLIAEPMNQPENLPQDWSNPPQQIDRAYEDFTINLDDLLKLIKLAAE